LKNYSQFIKNALLLITIIIGCLWLIPLLFANTISDKESYIARTVDKEKRLRQIKSPKLVIIGGSGSAYSIDSKKLEDNLKIPVANMALAYGLGLDFMIEEIAHSINKGDQILIIPEYYLPNDGNKKLITLLKDVNPEAKQYIKLDLVDQIKLQIVNFQRVGSSLFYKYKNNNENTAKRSDFNLQGDIVYHLNKSNIRPLKDQEKLYNALYNKEINKMNWLWKLAKSRGANVYISFPAYPKSEFQKNKEPIKFFEKRLKTKVNISVLNNPEQNIYDEIEFYDTVYHLNSHGRQKRTDYLIKLLTPILH
jgi:hypothetical protein